MFLTGPAVVREVMGEDVSAAELGGHKVHERNGVAHFVADRRRRRRAARPRPARPPARQHAASAPPRWRCRRPARLRPRRAGARTTSARSTTCATSSAALVDGGRLLECAPRWARNIVCGFARIDGRAGRRRSPTSRSYLGGVLDAESAPRARASCAPATRSACRSSCSSTRPASCPARAQEQARRDPPRRQARARVRRGDACRRSRSCCARRSAARSSP